jgi:hypothetical protein
MAAEYGQLLNEYLKRMIGILLEHQWVILSFVEGAEFWS